jgi:L-lactate dehydrogenase (cytochrome)/(S)-mandelate dehydrogenase
MQVFLYRDRPFTKELVRRAEAANYDGIVLTIDNQLLGKRERDLANGFTIPPEFSLVQSVAMLGKIKWWWRMRGELRRITFGNYVRPGKKEDIKKLASRMAELLDPALSWKDVDWIRGMTSKPLIIKGILSGDEAEAAINHGADAIVVSNHGGRQLDGAVSSLDALPGIVRQVDGRIPVLLDGGVRRGTDVVIALALGATACLLGRPQLWGVAVAGEAGVRHLLEIYAKEIDTAMGLCGVGKIADIDLSLLANRPGNG